MTKQDDRVNTTSTKTPNAGGAPLGNTNHLTHGVSKLEAERKRGAIDRRTSPYRAMKKPEREIAINFNESRKRSLAQDCSGQYYVDRVSEHLLTLKHVIRKGKVNPSVPLLLELSNSVEGGFETLGKLLEKETEKNKQPDLARRYMTGGQQR